MGRLGLVAHGVSVPIREHRREEFKRRAIYMSRQFDTIIFSLDKGLSRILEEEDEYVRVIRVPLDYIRSSSWLKRLIRTYEVDVLFCDTLGDAIPVAYAMMGRRKPALVVFLQAYEACLNALYVRELMKMEVKRSFLEKLLWPKDAFLMRLSDRILCVSRWLVRYATMLTKRQNAVYVPCSLAYLKDLPRDQDWVRKLMAEVASRVGVQEDDLKPICYSGVLSSNKRPDIAIRAQKLVARKFPECVLLVAGDGPGLRSMMTLARELKLGSNVVFLRGLPQYRAITLMSACHVMVHPSLSEGWSMSIGEAMALGCPVVCYANESATEQTRGEGGVLIRSLDPRDYARAVCRLLSDDGLRAEIAERAKELMRSHVELPEEKRFEMICEHIQAYVRGR